MKINKIRILTILLVFALTLSACAQKTPTEDPAVKITQVAATVIAQLTQNAALTPSATPTPTATATLMPTETPTATLGTEMDATSTPSVVKVAATPSSDNSIFVADLTIPDNTIVKSGTTFTKTWRIKNTGQNVWKKGAYRLMYLEGMKAAGDAIVVKMPYSVRPNETIDFSVDFVAPAGSGKYESYWQLENSDNQLFGQVLSLVFYSGQP